MVQNETRIFGIGTSGLVGSRVAALLASSYPISHHSSKTGFDITSKESVSQLVHDTDHEIVLLMAAKTDVDGCEKDKIDEENGEAWKVNVAGTQNIVDACKRANKKLIYISTDFVFSGEETPKDGYDETNTPSPINWYGETKYKGEIAVMESGLPYFILRIAYPYRKEYLKKKDFVRAVISRLEQGSEVHGITDHIMTPTFIDDIAIALQRVLKENATGILHVVGSEFITPFNVVSSIAETFGFDTSLIKKTTRSDYFKNGASRPFNLALKNDKIESLGVKMRTFKEGLEELLKAVNS